MHNKDKGLCVLPIRHLVPCELCQVSGGPFQMLLVGLGREKDAEKWMSSVGAKPDELLLICGD